MAKGRKYTTVASGEERKTAANHGPPENGVFQTSFDVTSRYPEAEIVAPCSLAEGDVLRVDMGEGRVLTAQIPCGGVQEGDIFCSMYQIHSPQPISLEPKSRRILPLKQVPKVEKAQSVVVSAHAKNFYIHIEGQLGYEQVLCPGESGNDKNWHRCISEDQIIPDAFALPDNDGCIDIPRPVFEIFRREVNTSLEGMCLKLRRTLKSIRRVQLAFLCSMPLFLVFFWGWLFLNDCDFSEEPDDVSQENICHRLGVVGVIALLTLGPCTGYPIFLAVSYPLVRNKRRVASDTTEQVQRICNGTFTALGIEACVEPFTFDAWNPVPFSPDYIVLSLQQQSSPISLTESEDDENELEIL